MSSISGISGSSYTQYGNYASGKKLNSAADGASELAIAEKQKSQATTSNVMKNNVANSRNQLNISEASLQGVNDYLQDIRANAIKASNGTNSASDKASIQKDIDGAKQGISQLIGSDGLKNLGIADFSVTGDFDVKTIDDALSSISSQRSAIGAQSNGYDYMEAYYANQSENTTSSVSRLEDLDYAEAISETKKNQTLETYQMMMQKKTMESQGNLVNNLIG